MAYQRQHSVAHVGQHDAQGGSGDRADALLLRTSGWSRKSARGLVRRLLSFRSFRF